MNTAHWLELERRDQDTFRAVVAFLENRIESIESVDWALIKATPSKMLRVAILHLLNAPSGRALKEPWRSAWRLIQEFWENRQVDYTGDTGEYQIQSRLNAGERSASLIRELVDLVAPRLSIEVHTTLTKSHSGKGRRPKSVNDLFAMSMTSKRAVDQDVLGLSEISEAGFLSSLGHALEVAIREGLELGTRLGWDGGPELWRLGQLYRVYRVQAKDLDGEEHEPDEFHEGISPSVKLLYATLDQLIKVDREAGLEFTKRWKNSASPIFLRLWAALARMPNIAPALDVSSSLLTMSHERFWLVNYFPEIAELRARRFNDLSPEDQKRLTDRIKRLPPRKIWPHVTSGEDLKEEQLLAALRELLRIQAAGGVLDAHTQQWIKTRASSSLKRRGAGRIEDGFPGTPKAQWVKSTPDARFDALKGENRLEALAQALLLPRESWQSDPAQRASDWLQQPQSISRILNDLEAARATNKGAAALWERLGWAHTPQNSGAATEKDIGLEAKRVLSLLVDLPVDVLSAAVDGISHWLSSWQTYVVSTTLGRAVWGRVWPIAVDATNEQEPRDDRSDLNATGRSSSGGRQRDLDTLNTPAGKLVGVFLSGCPSLLKVKKPFSKRRPLRAMRDTIVASSGRAHLIAIYRMIESLAYFLAADRQWALAVLVAPLNAFTRESNTLWRALGRRHQFKEVVQELGAGMMQRSVDQTLDRKTRQILSTNLVVECLDAYLTNRTAVVAPSGVQQMLRSVEEEVRANVATVFAQFVIEVSSSEGDSFSADEVFKASVAPFLKRVWPQESSLTSVGVSKALAVLPAAAKEAFADAVESIDRFLVPFDAWSMIDYGLYGELEGQPKLGMVNDLKKANAFLSLLDKTVGNGERAVVPHELALALAHIRKVAPDLAQTSSFRRLATMTRR